MEILDYLQLAPLGLSPVLVFLFVLGGKMLTEQRKDIKELRARAKDDREALEDKLEKERKECKERLDELKRENDRLARVLRGLVENATMDANTRADLGDRLKEYRPAQKGTNGVDPDHAA